MGVAAVTSSSELLTATTRKTRHASSYDWQRWPRQGSARHRLGASQSWTLLTPATVAMKEVEHQVVIGNWRHALVLAERIPRTQRTLPDDRHRHELDLAKVHAELADYSTAVDILAELQSNAPHWLRHQRLGREVTRQVLASRKRALPGELRALADFFDLGA